MAITCISLLIFVFLGENTGLPYIIGGLFLLGFGLEIFTFPNIISSVDKKTYGVASAIFTTARLSGNMLSMGIVMVLFSLFIWIIRLTTFSLLLGSLPLAGYVHEVFP
jgi:hypothetical protein